MLSKFDIIVWENNATRGVSIKLWEPILGMHEWIVLVDLVQRQARISFWAGKTDGVLREKIVAFDHQTVDEIADVAVYFLLGKTPYLELLNKR